jgi:hypothetical protein
VASGRAGGLREVKVFFVVSPTFQHIEPGERQGIFVHLIRELVIGGYAFQHLDQRWVRPALLDGSERRAEVLARVVVVQLAPSYIEFRTTVLLLEGSEVVHAHKSFHPDHSQFREEVDEISYVVPDLFPIQYLQGLHVLCGDRFRDRQSIAAAVRQDHAPRAVEYRARFVEVSTGVPVVVVPVRTVDAGADSAPDSISIYGVSIGYLGEGNLPPMTPISEGSHSTSIDSK